MTASKVDDIGAVPRCKHAYTSSIALERAAASRGVQSLSNARVFAARLLNAPPTKEGGGLQPCTLAVGRGWLIATDAEFEALTGAPAVRPNHAALHARRRELELIRNARKRGEP